MNNPLNEIESIMALRGYHPSRQSKIDIGRDLTRELYTNTDSNGIRNRNSIQFAASASPSSSEGTVEGLRPVPSSTAARPGEERQRNTGQPNTAKVISLGKTRKEDRKVSTQDLYVLITAAMGNVKNTGGDSRASVYLSLRAELDKKFSIFLRSAITTRVREVKRSIEKTDNKPLLTIYEDIINQKHKGQMIGRIRYNAGKWPIRDLHRKNLKHGLFEVHLDNDALVGTLFLLGEEYPFNFSDSDDRSEKQQMHYSAVATYEAEVSEFDGSDEMCDPSTGVSEHEI